MSDAGCASTLLPGRAAVPVAAEAPSRLAFRTVALRCASACEVFPFRWSRPAFFPGNRRESRWRITPAAGIPRALRLLSPVAVLFAAVFPIVLLPGWVHAAQAPNIPGLQLSFSGGSMQPRDVALGLEILFLLTVLSLAPAIVLTITSFTRIIVVFHFVRQALGVQQLPPNQVLVSLAIFMSAAIMFPVGKAVNDTALQPYLEERMDFAEALSNAEKPIREFMYKHTREKDLSVFYSITRMERPATRDDVPLMSLAAAFMISELKTGFIIGFLIYIPFLILDMVISSILLAMGMMMLPPMMVSMPFKLLLFVMVDGWTLLVGSLVNSFIL